MRKEAHQNTKDLLDGLKSRVAAASGARHVGQPGMVSVQIKEKLQNATNAMQEGLVERDTEVGTVQ